MKGALAGGWGWERGPLGPAVANGVVGVAGVFAVNCVSASGSFEVVALGALGISAELGSGAAVVEGGGAYADEFGVPGVTASSAIGVSARIA